MKNKEAIKNDLTFIEVCNLLKKSRRTISRYISNGRLNPKRVKSDRGSLEYRFELKEIENFKISGKVARTDRQDTRQAIRQNTGQDNEVITLLKETTQTLRDQLNVKDKQIRSLGNKIDGLIERGREANILINGLANRVLMLEDKKREDRPDRTGQDTRQDRGQNIRGFFKRLFKGSPES